MSSPICFSNLFTICGHDGQPGHVTTFTQISFPRPMESPSSCNQKTIYPSCSGDGVGCGESVCVWRWCSGQRYVTCRQRGDEDRLLCGLNHILWAVPERRARWLKLFYRQQTVRTASRSTAMVNTTELLGESRYENWKTTST